MTVDNIIDTIQKNRISSVEIADALNKQGVIDGISAFNTGHFAVGRVSYVCTYNDSNWPIHEQIRGVNEGDIVFVDAIGCDNRAIFGDLVAKYLILYKKCKALVVNGLVRDAHRLRKENHPVWCKGATPLGCFNNETKPDETTKIEIEKRRNTFDGSIMVCDDSGCTLIRKDELTNNFVDKLNFIELQEDIWYFCIDTLKLDTFDTICKKVYLENMDLLPKNLRDRLLKFQESFND